MKTFFSTRSCACQGAPRALLCGLLALLVVACAPISAPVQSPMQDKSREIDKLFRWATLETPGCAVAVAQHGAVVVNRAYGLANLETAIPISSNTMFDIGSVQKQFVAAAILLLVNDGDLALSDDIRAYFPELPDYGHVITVEHLLTHTSGIRDWTALQQLSAGDEDALTLILRQRGLNFTPGEEWSYSNSGYVLLKEIIARVTGMPFSTFAQERLFTPLGMDLSMYTDDVRNVEERALAYELEDDGWELNILVGNERGDGGALLSAASDLLIWNEALTNARLGTFVTEQLQKPARLNNGRDLSYARGLFLDEEPFSRIVWHSGSAAGYKTMLARLPEQGLSLATLCNAGESAGEQNFVTQLIDLFVLDTHAPAAESRASAGAPASGLTDRAGLFINVSRGEVLQLVIEGDKLYVDDGPELVEVAQDRYRNERRTLTFMSDAEVELHFLSSDEIELTTSQDETVRYRRVQPYAPTAAELENFVGSYASEELNALLDIALADGGLTISLNGSPAFAFMPIDRATFLLGRMLVHFRQDERGEVVGLDYSNPVLRNVYFTRGAIASARSE